MQTPLKHDPFLRNLPTGEFQLTIQPIPKMNLKSSFVLNLLVLVGLETKAQPIKLITVDPGHFHAALVQKSMYPEIDPKVFVYAKEGIDLQLHLDRVSRYNNRKDNPTQWEEKVYTGEDFFQKCSERKKETW